MRGERHNSDFIASRLRGNVNSQKMEFRIITIPSYETPGMASLRWRNVKHHDKFLNQFW